MMVNELPQGWHITKFNEIFSKVDRKIIVDDGQVYDCTGVRWYGKGAFIRERLLGANISRKQQWIIKSGDIVYNKLFAWKGAFAVADDSVDGCIVSDKFPTYKANTELIEPKYLSYYFMAPKIALNAQEFSKGAAAISKLTLNPPQFWELTIPLPPLTEQRRIVERIEALAARIAEARKLRLIANAQTKIFLNSSIGEILDKGNYNFRPLKDVLDEPLQNGLSIPASEIGQEGILFAKVGIVNSGKINPKETKRVNISLSDNSPFWMRPGDVFVSRGNSLVLVGRAAVYEAIPANCAFTDLLIRIRVNKTQINPHFLVYYFQTLQARKYIEKEASGTSPSMKKISQPKLERMLIPVPSLDEQHHMLTFLDEMQEKLDLIRKFQDKSTNELEALMPSILDRAFKGEL